MKKKARIARFTKTRTYCSILGTYDVIAAIRPQTRACLSRSAVAALEDAQGAILRFMVELDKQRRPELYSAKGRAAAH